MHRCPQCSYEFEWQFEVNYHVQRAHRNAVCHASATPEQSQCVCCEHQTYHGAIDETSLQISFYLAELSGHNYPCKYCQFVSNASLIHAKHQYDHHYRKLKHYKCTQCSHRTNRKTDLKTHMLRHAQHDEVNWFPCDKCSYKANRKCSLKRHMLTHSEIDVEKLFECPICGCKTKHKSSLRTHMLKHIPTEKFKCTVCQYETKRKDSLKLHMLKHASAEQIEWFPCGECSYKAKRKCNLRMHMLKYGHSELNSNVPRVHIISNICLN